MRTDPRQIVLSLPYEEWRPISGAAGYFVSNCGRVCSVDRIVERKGGRGSEVLRSGQLIEHGIAISGHHYVLLGRKFRAQVHRLVLETFVGHCPDGCEGLHFDDDTSNNNVVNLRWGTRSENLHDAVRNGKRALGEHKPQSKLTDERVRFIRAHPQMGLRELANAFGVHDNAIRQVREFITWKHVA